MNMKDIRTEVRRQAPPSMKNSWLLKNTMRYFQESMKLIKDNDLTSVANNIIGMAMSLKGSDDPTMFEWDFITNDSLIDMIKPIVTQTRINIFNNPEPPFNNLVDAGNWIYKESAIPIPEDKKKEAQRYLDFCDSYMSSVIKREIWNCGSSIEFKNLTITFPGIKEKNKGWTESVPVGWSENLYRLNTCIKQIANITDFPKYAITAHVLTGIKPIQPKYRIETPFYNSKISMDDWHMRNQVVIKINAADLTFEDLKKIYKEYRKRLNFTRKKGITNKQKLIYQMVENSGGAPGTDITKFWREIVEKWNSEYPDDAYTRWEGIYKAYNGAKAKILPRKVDIQELLKNKNS